MKLKFIICFIALSVLINPGFSFAQFQTQKPSNPSPDDWLKEAIILNLSMDDLQGRCTYEQILEKLSRLKQYGINVLYLPKLFDFSFQKKIKGDNRYPLHLTLKPVHSTTDADKLKSFINKVNQAGFKLILEFPDLCSGVEPHQLEEYGDYFRECPDKKKAYTLDFSKDIVRIETGMAIKSMMETYPIDGFGFLSMQKQEMLKVIEVVHALSQDHNLVIIARHIPFLKQVSNVCFLQQATSDALNECLFNPANFEQFIETYRAEMAIDANYAVYLRPNEIKTSFLVPLNDPLTLKRFKLKTVLDFTMGSHHKHAVVPMITNENKLGQLFKESLCLNQSDVWENEQTKSFMDLYLKLGFMRLSHKVFFNGTMKRIKTANDNQLFAFIRENDSEKSLVVVNLLDKPFTGYMEVDQQEMLHNFMNPEKYRATKDGNIKISLDSYGYLIYIYN
jgi:hypothetical protein